MFPHERSLVERLKDKPFALIGVNTDKDLAMVKKQVVEQNITWRSFWCGPEGTGGALPKVYHVKGYPTIYVLDDKGVIRYKGVRGEQMDKAVDTLLGGMTKETGSGK